ncbi:g patch domain-containing protein [Anaeramoeba flamelloides]|uniref:G patch domain-containing protein n=1 Tax=Anaeramoeba flamelloides TaxID=1746091 RepID=A0ABQ8YV88_9EUKA|nr:g patch domain-containing protein [Anaeramoeba flamelloides]
MDHYFFGTLIEFSKEPSILDTKQNQPKKFVSMYEQKLSRQDRLKLYGYYYSTDTNEGFHTNQKSFLSSRNSRKQIENYRPEDFMDEEDRIDHGLTAQTLKRKDEFKVFDFEGRKRSTRNYDSIIPTTEPIGIRLLRMVGWDDEDEKNKNKEKEQKQKQKQKEQKEKEKEKEQKEKEKEKEQDKQVTQEPQKKLFFGPMPPPNLETQKSPKIKKETKGKGIKDLFNMDRLFEKKNENEYEKENEDEKESGDEKEPGFQPYQQKNDQYGLGYDPYQGASEFELANRLSRPTKSGLIGDGSESDSDEDSYSFGVLSNKDNKEHYSKYVVEKDEDNRQYDRQYGLFSESIQNIEKERLQRNVLSGFIFVDEVKEEEMENEELELKYKQDTLNKNELKMYKSKYLFQKPRPIRVPNNFKEDQRRLDYLQNINKKNNNNTNHNKIQNIEQNEKRGKIINLSQKLNFNANSNSNSNQNRNRNHSRNHNSNFQNRSQNIPKVFPNDFLKQQRYELFCQEKKKYQNRMGLCKWEFYDRYQMSEREIRREIHEFEIASNKNNQKNDGIFQRFTSSGNLGSLPNGIINPNSLLTPGKKINHMPQFVIIKSGSNQNQSSQQNINKEGGTVQGQEQGQGKGKGKGKEQSKGKEIVREESDWIPNRLLCKRFNVKFPERLEKLQYNKNIRNKKKILNNERQNENLNSMLINNLFNLQNNNSGGSSSNDNSVDIVYRQSFDLNEPKSKPPNELFNSIFNEPENKK